MMRVLGFAAFVLCGCVGPNFHEPAPPHVDRYTIDAQPVETGSAQGPDGAAQKFLRNAKCRETGGPCLAPRN